MALRKIGALDRQIKACRILEKLDLTREQMEKLADLAHRGQEERIRHERRVEEARKVAVPAFEDFRREDISNKGFSKEVERATGAANQRLKKLRERRGKALSVAEEEIRTILTPEQVRLVAPEKKNESRGAELRRELAEINGAAHAPLATFLMNPGTVAILEARLGRGPVETESCTDESLAAKERNLREDINVLNLLNGIYFSPHQMEHLVDVLKNLEKLEPKGSVDLKSAEGLTRTLEEIVALLIRGDEVPADLRRRERAQRSGLIARSGKRAQAGMDRMIREVEGVLTESQKAVLLDYKRCLIPPKNLKDPVRVGQSSSGEAQIRFLKPLRKMPQARWERGKDRIVENVLSNIEERGGKFPDDEREGVKDRLRALIEKVRGMSDEDFELNSEELAEEAEFLNRKHRIEEELKELGGNDRNVIRAKIRSNLLQPNVLPLLEQRLKDTRAFETENGVDLDEINPAPSCKDGCGLKKSDGAPKKKK